MNTGFEGYYHKDFLVLDKDYQVFDKECQLVRTDFPVFCRDFLS